MNKRVDVSKSRSVDQLEVMKNLEEQGICPFCPEHINDVHTEEILAEGDHWLLTPVRWPYDGTKYHLFAIAKYHAETFSDLKDGAGDELFALFKWAEETYQIEAGGIAARFGNIDQTGASVSHLHIHMMVPDSEWLKDNDEKLKFKISS